jgi:uncharacterized protein YneF (UPF0154 family)
MGLIVVLVLVVSIFGGALLGYLVTKYVSRDE